MILVLLMLANFYINDLDFDSYVSMQEHDIVVDSSILSKFKHKCVDSVACDDDFKHIIDFSFQHIDPSDVEVYVEIFKVILPYEITLNPSLPAPLDDFQLFVLNLMKVKPIIDDVPSSYSSFSIDDTLKVVDVCDFEVNGYVDVDLFKLSSIFYSMLNLCYVFHLLMMCVECCVECLVFVFDCDCCCVLKVPVMFIMIFDDGG